MAYLDPQEAFESFRDGVIGSLKTQFPLEGKAHSVHLENIEVPEKLHPDNVRDQQTAKTDGRTWAENVFGTVVLKDNVTGKEIERKRMRMAEIPRMTKRYSYVVGGQEYQIDNQWQLKPGAYARRRQQGELEVQFNTQGGKSFDMMFDPAKKKFEMEWNKAKVPAYPVLKAMGISDAQLEKTWGSELLEANKKMRGVAGTLQRMYKADKGTAVSPEQAEEYVREQLKASGLNADATNRTLGKPLDHVNGEALHLATKRLLDMQAGGKEDDRDSLIFKRLRTAGDFAEDKMRANSWRARSKMIRKLDGSAKGVRDVVKFEHFNTPIIKTFNDNQASRVASQINPLEMVSASMQTTVMGPGGIKSEHGIVDETKFINTSHFGFLDPINTPEGCADSETEVFTDRGWVRWPEVREGDLFACLIDGRMCFHPAHKLVTLPFSGELYGLDTTRTTKRPNKPLKYLMTPGHRVWSRPVDGAGYRFDLAPEMHGKARVFQVGHAPHGGKPDDYFKLPYVEGNNSSFHAPLLDIEDWAEFMGWFLSEGNVSITPTKRGYYNYHAALFQSDLPGADGCERIEALLNRLPFTWHREERKNHRIRYTIACKQLALYLVQFGLSYEKFIPECAFNWSLPAREALLRTLLSGDGRLTQLRKNGTWANEVYTTTSRELALGVERLVISLGHAVKISSYEDKREERYRDVYEVRIFQCPERNVQKRNLKAYFKQKYEGMVYCAEVPGGMLYMRRDGGIGHWTGNSKTGVSLRLPLGVKKVGEDPMVPLYNLKTNKMEMVPPATMMSQNVVLPDQVDWTGKKPRMIGKTVKMFASDNELKEGDGSKATYAMRYPTQVFNITSNLVPFLHSTQGNRAGMATRHMEQAISLKEREKPLVQVSTGFDRGDVRSFEQLLGKQAGHTAPMDGTIKKVTKDGIIIQNKEGEHEVQMYNNYPLTDAKSMLHSEPLVKAGQKVKKGETIADTNYSKDGHLALGTNMRVAYLPYRGYNFEDGIVISESASKKLSSEHMQKLDVKVDDKTTVGRSLFTRKHSGTFTKDQLEGIDEDGVVKVGQKVRPGDPLVLATAPFQVKDRVGLGAIRKSLSGVHSDKSAKWNSDFMGEVVAVHKKKDGMQVHVRSTESMQVGDKLCFDEQTEVLTRSGWKSVKDVTLEDEVCCLGGEAIEYERPTELHAYPRGGRMYRIESQQVDLFVTGEHRMYVKPRTTKKLLDKFTLMPASEVSGKRVRYKKDGAWAGCPVEEFVLPPLRVLAGKYGHGERMLPELRMPMNTYLMLLGMYLSEGNIVNQPKYGNYGIDITQVKEPNRTELRQVLEAVGIKYCNHARGGKVRIYSKQLMKHFEMFGHAEEKYVPREVFELSKSQLEILFSWMMWGDGHDNGKLPVNYVTTSPRLADDMQQLCLHIGIAANISSTDAGWQTIKGQHYWCRTCYDVRIVSSKLHPQVNHGHTKTQRAQKEYWVEDYREPVYCVTVPSHVLYVRRNGKPVWSGNSGRYGNKGIVTKIMPDNEMPRTKDGKPIQVALNPFGVPGRLNPSQIIETVTAKVAEKIGKPILVKNFGTTDQIRDTKALAKKHGVVDAEELYDPITGHNLGKVTVGPQYMLKLVHQVEKKGSVRSGMSTPGGEQEKYDHNLMPGQGGHHGGQAIGSLGLYALLAHGAKANIREMQTIKSEGEDPQTNPVKKWKSQHKKVWEALQMGTPVPTPKPTFAFEKFTSYMKAAGVNMDKKGHEFILSPMTDAQVKTMSSGELPSPDMKLSYKVNDKGEPTPIKGGLFDEGLTGGHGGKKWTHIKLAEPVPNPMFEKAIKSITGLKKKDYDAIVYGEKAVLPNGQLTDKTDQGTTGGAGIKMLLGNIDVASQLKQAKVDLSKAPETKVDPALKKVKYLQALQKVGLKPEEAYVLHNLPVIPPAMRPASLMQDGSVNEADLNGLYSQFATTNRQLGDPKLRKYEQAEDRKETRKEFYDGVRAIMGVGVPYADQKQKGLLHQIHGAQPKSGMFQDALNNRRQDLTMRSTIVPEPSLGLDEVGLPKQYALNLFKPFVVKQMVQMGHAKHALEAQAMIDKKDPRATIALEKVMEDRPVVMKRDPVLHKYGVQGHKPRLVEGSAIKIHPLTCSGYNADFDGDEQLGAVIAIISERCYNEHEALFAPRRIAATARFEETIGYVDSSDVLVLCNLEDFPHHDEKVTRGHIDFHPVPSGIRVVAMDEKSGEPVLAKVSGWSFHRKREIEIVTLGSGRQIITDDDERAVYGVDASSLKWCRRRPREANNQFVPVMDVAPEYAHNRTRVAVGGYRLRETVAMGKDFGYFLGAAVGDGWAGHAAGKAVSANLGNNCDQVIAAWENSTRCIFAPGEGETFTYAWMTQGKLGNSAGSGRSTSACTALAGHLANWIGRGANDKHLPPFFYSASDDFVCGLLSGLWDTDGSVSWSCAKNRRQFMCQYTSNSIRLVQEIQHLLRSRAISSTITSTSTPMGKSAWVLNVSIVDLHGAHWMRLDLAHPGKRALLKEFLEGPAPDTSMAYSRFKLVPVPAALASEMRTLLRAPRDAGKERKSLYVTLSKAMDRQYMSKDLAGKLLDLFHAEGKKCSHPLFAQWVHLVRLWKVHFERVLRVERTGVEEDGYDLTVPGYETFMNTEGVVLSNTMSMFVPVTDEAQREARKMMPSNNLFSDSTGRVMYSPGHEGAAGLYRLGSVSKKNVTKVKSAGEAVDMVRKGKLEIHDRVSFGGNTTTPGRVLVSSALPTAMQKKVLTDLSMDLGKKGVANLLKEVGTKHKGEFGTVADRLNELGNGTSFGVAPVLTSDQIGSAALDPKNRMWVPTKALTLTLDDFDPDRGTRDRLLAVAGKKVKAIRGLKVTDTEKERRTVDAWRSADRAIQILHEAKSKRTAPNNLQIMKNGAGKPSQDQYKQLAMAPMLVQDTSGRVIPVPITKSFGEGLDVSQYWAGMYGARRGLVRKVQEVQDPGVLSKMMQNTAMDQVVTSEDCGTGRGIAMPVTDKEIHDRVLAAPLRAGKLNLGIGTVMSPDVVGQIRSSKKDAMVVVRSPLKCEHEHGICQKCMGLGPDGKPPEIGTNVGVQATHALGEPTTQLMMRSFHTGGVVGKANVSDQFKHVENLMKMPDKVDNQATLSNKGGTIDKIERDRVGTRMWVGGKEHFVGKDRYGVDLSTPPVKAYDNPDYEPWQAPKVGMRVKPGQSLSDPNRTVVNPKELYKATGNISIVQNHLTSGLHDMFGPEGVRRVHSEVMVRAMTGSTKVQNPGDHSDILRGEVHNSSRIRSLNKQLKQQGKKPIIHSPHLKGIDMLPLSVRDDWMAKLQHTRLRDTLIEASAQGASSNIHGTHPIPGVAYGAEFGFNEQQSKRPGFEKYKNVPKYSY